VTARRGIVPVVGEPGDHGIRRCGALGRLGHRVPVSGEGRGTVWQRADLQKQGS